MREKILLVGDSNTSKTLSLISLAILMPDRKVVIFDPDDGFGKILSEMGLTMGDLPNLSIIPVYSDFDKLLENYREVKSTLGEGDWLGIDMLARFWDFAQNHFSRAAFGMSVSEHLVALKKQSKMTSFNGFDGLDHWPTIKRLHNEELIDDAVLWSPFNVMCTTSVTSLSPKEKVPTTGIRGIYASEFGIKPEGEKHNIYRFDTQAVMYRNTDNTYHFRIVRDRGRAVDIKEEFDITGKSFFEVYSKSRGLVL